MTLHAHLGASDPLRCGCDRDATGTLMPLDEALGRALELVRPVAATERLALPRATGRVLAGAVHARRPLDAGPDAPAPGGTGRGEEILPAGRVIGPREAGLLASAGQGRVEVRRRIAVALLSIGPVPSAPGGLPGPDPTRTATVPLLAAHLSAPWITLRNLGALPGDPARLPQALAEAAGRADLIVTAGGVPVGGEDALPRLVRQAGGTVPVGSVAMRPGRHLRLGEIGGTPWIGLSGDPVSAFVGWTVIGARMAEALAGLAGGRPRKEVVRLARPAAHSPGRCEFRPARLLGYDAHGTQAIELLSGKAGGRLTLLARADGLGLIPAGAEALLAGTLLEFLPF